MFEGNWLHWLPFWVVVTSTKLWLLKFGPSVWVVDLASRLKYRLWESVCSYFARLICANVIAFELAPLTKFLVQLWHQHLEYVTQLRLQITIVNCNGFRMILWPIYLALFHWLWPTCSIRDWLNQWWVSYNRSMIKYGHIWIPYELHMDSIWILSCFFTFAKVHWPRPWRGRRAAI